MLPSDRRRGLRLEVEVDDVWGADVTPRPGDVVTAVDQHVVNVRWSTEKVLPSAAV